MSEGRTNSPPGMMAAVDVMSADRRRRESPCDGAQRVRQSLIRSIETGLLQDYTACIEKRVPFDVHEWVRANASVECYHAARHRSGSTVPPVPDQEIQKIGREIVCGHLARHKFNLDIDLREFYHYRNRDHFIFNQYNTSDRINTNVCLP